MNLEDDYSLKQELLLMVFPLEGGEMLQPSGPAFPRALKTDSDSVNWHIAPCLSLGILEFLGKLPFPRRTP